MEFKKDLFKRDIVPELACVPGNSNAIMRVTMAKEIRERKKREDEERFTKKGNEEHDRNVQRIIKNNAEDWENSEVSINKLRK
jgi:hypothetical protein